MTSRMWKIRGGAALMAVLFLSLFCPVAGALRKDEVVMVNGDHLTGEVKRLENGLLYFETEYVTDNIPLDWDHVASVKSTANFQIVLIDGKRLVGRIERVSGASPNNQDFIVRGPGGDTRVSAGSVASFNTEKSNFFRQLTGSIDAGYSFTSGNSQTTFNADANATYRATSWEAGASFDTTFSGQAGASKTNRQDLQADYNKYLNRNYYLGVLSDFLHSSQQDLVLRSTVGGGYGRYLKRTATTQLSWIGGLVFTNESFNTPLGQPQDQNLEAILGLKYDVFRFNFGEAHAQYLIFPGLTDSGRVRMSTNNSLTIKLRNNFHLDFIFWDNFDSRPPVTAKKNELGVSTGLGWSF